MPADGEFVRYLPGLAQDFRCHGPINRHACISPHNLRHADASFQNTALPFTNAFSLSTLSIHQAHPQYPPLLTLSTSAVAKMRLPFLAAALLALLTTTSLAHNIQMGAHQRECFHEMLHKDDKMTVTFQVGDREFGGAGNLEIDFWIVGPTPNEYLVNQKAVSSGDHSFDARNDGKHVYCFSNEAWAASTKEVSFNVHGIVYVPESEAPSDPLEAEGVLPFFMFTFVGCGSRGLMVGAKVLDGWGTGWD